MTEPPDFLASFLERVDAPCPVCSYNLRGVALPHCPECRAPITLTVGSEQARLGPWLLAALGFAMGLGFDSVVSMLLLIPVVATRGESEALLMFAVMLTLAALSGAGLLLVVRRRRQFQSTPRRAQWKRAWAFFAAVFFTHLTVGLSTIVFLATR